MITSEILDKLESLGDEKVRRHNIKWGAHANQFGVKMGDIRAMAKPIKMNHELAKELWTTGNIEARFLATLIINPRLYRLPNLTAWYGLKGLHRLWTGYMLML